MSDTDRNVWRGHGRRGSNVGDLIVIHGAGLNVVKVEVWVAVDEICRRVSCVLVVVVVANCGGVCRICRERFRISDPRGTRATAFAPVLSHLQTLCRHSGITGEASRMISWVPGEEQR